MKRTKIGIIGCGAISPAYLGQCPKFEILEVAACADLMPERAEARAKEFNVPKACTVDELLADPEIEIVVNITIPAAHHSVAMSIVEAGKSVWNEKPLTITRAEGAQLLETAKKNGVLVGCAPDTFLGAGLQTCIKLIDDGAIGKPVASTAFMLSPGVETWHPNPEFYYKVGGGPMFDMGPYYLTALISMMGPVRRVSGSTGKAKAERLITSQPYAGQVVTVDVPTHVAGLLDFANGAIGTIIMSFDVHATQLPCIEVYGTEGTIAVPDPNGTGGAVRLRKAGALDWEDVPHTHAYKDISRSTGVADMAYALRSGRPHRASGDLAFHVLDLMHAFHDASDQGTAIDIKSGCERPAPMPLGLAEGVLDE